MIHPLNPPHTAVLIPGGLENPALGLYIPALMDLVTRLSQRLHLHIFSLRGPQTSGDSGRIGGAALTYLPEHAGMGLMRKLNGYRRAFVREHRRRPFSLIHGIWGLPSGLAAVLLGRRFGLSVLVSLQGAETARLPEADYGAGLTWKTRFLLNRTLRHARMVTALTQFQADLLPAGVTAEIIPYGAPGEHFRPAQRIPRPPYRFLHVAHQNPVKDQATLLRAFAQISARIPARLTLAGGDFMQGAVQRLASELGLRESVDFAGAIAHRELPTLFAEADCLLHTSLYEAQAVVIAEAMTAGVPVCATRVGLAADLDGSAVTAVPVGDHQTLAEEATALVTHETAWQNQREAGLAWSRDHDAAWTADRFARLYGELIGSGS
ncbi:MAG: glycosyltransferase family 4 protein [Acidobacteriota bacterium]|nr:glycosyltransferase family 4 protein [Acidobacteriota bacterium]